MSSAKSKWSKLNLSVKTILAGLGTPTFSPEKKHLIRLSTEKIPVNNLHICLNNILPKNENVYYQYGSTKKLCENTSAYGETVDLVLFYEHKEGYLENIWFTLDIKSSDTNKRAKSMFFALNQLGDFIIADWGWLFAEPLNNENRILDYLNARLDAFQHITR